MPHAPCRSSKRPGKRDPTPPRRLKRNRNDPSSNSYKKGAEWSVPFFQDKLDGLMNPQRVGILHPGEMGSAVAAAIRNSGHEVWWASESRSHLTRGRAESAGLTDAGTLANLCQTCPVIVSVCPPEFAQNMADQVLAHGFRGTYLDANAISPAHKQQIA